MSELEHKDVFSWGPGEACESFECGRQSPGLGVRRPGPFFAPSVRRGHDLWMVVFLSVTWHHEAAFS